MCRVIHACSLLPTLVLASCDWSRWKQNLLVEIEKCTRGNNIQVHWGHFAHHNLEYQFRSQQGLEVVAIQMQSLFAVQWARRHRNNWVWKGLASNSLNRYWFFYLIHPMLPLPPNLKAHSPWTLQTVITPCLRTRGLHYCQHIQEESKSIFTARSGLRRASRRPGPKTSQDDESQGNCCGWPRLTFHHQTMQISSRTLYFYDFLTAVLTEESLKEMSYIMINFYFSKKPSSHSSLKYALQIAMEGSWLKLWMLNWAEAERAPLCPCNS